MANYKYRKDKTIRLYRAETRKIDDIEVSVKVYYYFQTQEQETEENNSKLKAHIRQLSANERVSAKAVQDNSDLEVIINKRPVQQDMHMEFKGKTYQTGALDNYEFYNTEVKFRAQEVIPPDFDIVEFRRW